MVLRILTKSVLLSMKHTKLIDEILCCGFQRVSKMNGTYLKSLKKDEINKFLNSIDTFLFDCDGVLWIHKKPLPKSPEVINALKNKGKQIFYITNSNCTTREGLAKDCNRLNFPADEDNVLCTSYLVAYYLKNILNFQKKVYLIGSTALTQELNNAEIPYIGFGPDIMPKSKSTILSDIDPDVGAVVIGHDQHFSYPKMYKASIYLADKNVHLIAANPDEQYISANSNALTPGTGSFVKCIEACSNRKATVVGKPETFVADMIRKKYNVIPERTLMIGDTASTDILFGKNCGFKTLLVLSGRSNLEDLNKWKQSTNSEDKKFIPDYYTDSLGDLLLYLE